MANGSYASRDDVRQMGNDLLDRVFERMDDERDFRETQHAENKRDNSETKSLMQSMLTEAQRTNGRVTRLEDAIRTLKDDFESIRKRWHDFRESLTDAWAKKLSESITGEKGELAFISRLDLKTAIIIFVAGMSAIYSLLSLMGKVK